VLRYTCSIICYGKAKRLLPKLHPDVALLYNGLHCILQNVKQCLFHLLLIELQHDLVVRALYAVLAVDLANGLRKGDELNLQGRSIFKFSGDKIVAISDIS
jgi:hypothetical protein